MKRVIILGGSGFFGHLIAERLRAAGVSPIIASRTSGDARIDADDPAALRANLKQRDLVIDAAGPFQKRTPALVEAARTIGFDIIDLSDSAEYTSMIYEHEAPIAAAGIRVLTACSALSTVTALAVQSSGIEQPQWVRTYLMPASRYTANPATIQSFLAGVEGGARTFRFPDPIGNRSGLRVRSVDAVTIPREFPSIRTAELFVDTGLTSANLLLRFALGRSLVDRFRPAALNIARRAGATSGILGYEIASTLRLRQVVYAGAKSHMLAVVPATLAALAIVNGRFADRGLIAPTRHVDASEFRDAIAVERIETIVV